MAIITTRSKSASFEVKIKSEPALTEGEPFRGNNPSHEPIHRKRPPEDLPQDQYKGLGCHGRWIGAVRSISRSVCEPTAVLIFYDFLAATHHNHAPAPLSFWTSRQHTLANQRHQRSVCIPLQGVDVKERSKPLRNAGTTSIFPPTNGRFGTCLSQQHLPLSQQHLPSSHPYRVR